MVFIPADRESVKNILPRTPARYPAAPLAVFPSPPMTACEVTTASVMAGSPSAANILRAHCRSAPSRWRARFVESGRAGLENDAPGRGRKAVYGAEKQALDRTPPGLPLKKGRAGTMTHDYVRHGTTTLFAALNVADGTLTGPCQDRHRHQEWLKFLQQIDAETPADRALHLILDNYATHKHPKVKSGWPGIRVSTSTLRPPALRGATWSSASSAT